MLGFGAKEQTRTLVDSSFQDLSNSGGLADNVQGSLIHGQLDAQGSLVHGTMPFYQRLRSIESQMGRREGGEEKDADR